MNTGNKELEDAGWKALLSGQNGLRSVILAGGVLLHAMDVYLATTIMPSVTRDIGGLSFYSWATTIYIVSAIIGSVLSPMLLSRLGVKATYKLAILLFSAGALLCAVAPHMYVLLLGRLVQGAGGGLLFALSYAMINIILEESLWPRAMALVSVVWGISAFSGPFIGGIFAEYGMWRMAFAALLVLALLLTILADKVLPGRIAGQKSGNTKVPIGKILLITIAALAISTGGVMEDTFANVGGIVIAVIFLVLLIRSEREAAQRLLPHGAYRLSSALGATYMVIVLLTVATSVEIYVPYFMQVIHGFNPLRAGYISVLLSIGWSGASFGFSGVRGRQVGILMSLGPLLMVGGLTGLAVVVPSLQNSSGWGMAGMCLLILVIGLGVGMGWPHLLARVLTVAPKGEEDKASASITTVQLLATAFGTALAGLVANTSGIVHPGGIAGAQRAAVWLFGLFSIAALLAMVLLISGKCRSIPKGEA